MKAQWLLSGNAVIYLVSMMNAKHRPNLPRTPVGVYNRETRRLSRKRPVRLVLGRLKSGLPFAIGLSKQSPALVRVNAKRRAFLQRLARLERASPSKTRAKKLRLMKQAKRIDNEYFQATGFFKQEMNKRANEVAQKLPAKKA